MFSFPVKPLAMANAAHHLATPALDRKYEMSHLQGSLIAGNHVDFAARVLLRCMRIVSESASITSKSDFHTSISDNSVSRSHSDNHLRF